MAILLGSTVVAIGGSFNGNFPTYSTTGTIGCPTVGVTLQETGVSTHLHHPEKPGTRRVSPDKYSLLSVPLCCR